MSEVFISYARADREFAHRLCEALRSRGVEVWWDFDLFGGEDFRTRIRGVIENARRVVVLWSENSVQSHFVIDEASEAKRLGKLVPLSIDGASPPLGFGGLHTIRVQDIEADLGQIVASINALSTPRERAPAVAAATAASPNRRVFLGAAAAAVAAAGAGLGYRFWPSPEPQETFREAPALAAEREPDFSNLRRTALVIGNAGYENIHALQNPKRDAAAVAQALERRGFRVMLKEDLGKEAMMSAFQDFETTLSVVGGVGLFYYAGNAAHIDGVDLLLPVDTDYEAGRRELSGAINLTDLVKRISAKTTKAFSDDGYSIIYSASKGERAADGAPGTNSPFAVAFLDAIQHEKGELSAICRRVTGTMRANAQASEEANRLTRGAAPRRAGLRAPESWSQTPYSEEHGEKPFHFNDPSHDADIGVMKILILDSCRDNPFDAGVAAS